MKSEKAKDFLRTKQPGDIAVQEMIRKESNNYITKI